MTTNNITFGLCPVCKGWHNVALHNNIVCKANSPQEYHLVYSNAKHATSLEEAANKLAAKKKGR